MPIGIAQRNTVSKVSDVPPRLSQRHRAMIKAATIPAIKQNA